MSKPTASSPQVLPPSASVVPGLLVAAVVAAALWVVDQQHWLRGAGPPWLADLVALLAGWQLLAGIGLTVAALVTLAGDWARLLPWRRAGRDLAPTAPNLRESWIWHALQECWQQVRERHAVDDLKAEIARGHDHYARQLAHRWSKYYVLAFALPLVGFLFGLLNVKVQTTIFPFRDLFLPLVVGSLEMGVVLGGVVLLQLAGRAALHDWQWKANQLAPSLLGHARPAPPVKTETAPPVKTKIAPPEPPPPRQPVAVVPVEDRDDLTRTLGLPPPPEPEPERGPSLLPPVTSSGQGTPPAAPNGGADGGASASQKSSRRAEDWAKKLLERNKKKS
jgi:hypothetical protein